MRTPVVLSTVLAAAGVVTHAQERAPREEVKATVAGKPVSIEYGRPALKGRTLDELMKQLPADRVWRAGVDQVTTFKTDTDVLIGGKKIAAGKYSLYVHLPEDGSRSLILNSDTGVPLGKIWAAAPDNMKNEPWPHLRDYQKNAGASEVLRTPLRKEAVKTPVDLFTIGLSPAPEGASLELTWGDESWSIDVKPAK